jgi:hypothetical protein
MVYYMHDVQDEGFELVELTDHWNWKDRNLPDKKAPIFVNKNLE